VQSVDRDGGGARKNILVALAQAGLGISAIKKVGVDNFG